MSTRRSSLFVLSWVLLSLSLTGCASDGVLSFGDDRIPLDVEGYNHTDRSIGSFGVNDAGGSFLKSHSEGGAACCIGVPRDYKPGMTVRIRYTDEARENPQVRVVEVPPYRHQDLGHFAVHFLSNGEIKVFVTRFSLGHQDYPLKGKEAWMSPDEPLKIIWGQHE